VQHVSKRTVLAVGCVLWTSSNVQRVTYQYYKLNLVSSIWLLSSPLCTLQVAALWISQIAFMCITLSLPFHSVSLPLMNLRHFHLISHLLVHLIYLSSALLCILTKCIFSTNISHLRLLIFHQCDLTNSFFCCSTVFVPPPPPSTIWNVCV